MLSLYAFGKWAVAALVSLGWCYCAVPAMFSAMAKPALPAAARVPLLVLAAISAIPVLCLICLVWLCAEAPEAAPFRSPPPNASASSTDAAPRRSPPQPSTLPATDVFDPHHRSSVKDQ
jgi:hypothetical protein